MPSCLGLAWLALINSPAPQAKQAPQMAKSPSPSFTFRLIGLGLGKQQMADGRWLLAARKRNATQTAAASNRKSVVLVTGLWIHGSEREEEE
jgi:hypothetical protein